MDLNNSSGLVPFFEYYNKFMHNLFFFLKYILGCVLILIGILTLLKLRGIHLQQKMKQGEKDKDQLNIVRIILGMLFLFIGFGILFNFLIYLLIWAFDPLPDPFIFNFLSDIKIINIENFKDVEHLDHEYEKTLYYGIALGSFSFLLELILSIYYFANSNRLIHNPHSALLGIVGGLIGCLFFGFSTCLPLFL